MASYNGRRAPNVSQYIANLNTIPSASDMAAQQEFPAFDDDLAVFTNTQFFDFDMGENMPEMPGNMNFAAPNPAQTVPQEANKNMGYVNPPNFNYEFSFQTQQPQHRPHPHSLPTSPQNGLPFATQAQQSQPTVPNAIHFAGHHQHSPNIGEKRQSTVASLPSTADLEEDSRNAADEDKRRRNTAASARFRVKKKQREQALEKSAKEMSDKVQTLEARVGQLEMENQWLKGLITERNLRIDVSGGAPSKLTAKNTGDIDEETKAIQLNKADAGEDVIEAERSDSQGAKVDESSPQEKKRGVGTKGAAVEV